MKRSQVNALLREAEKLFAEAGIALPAWARWSPAEWAARPEVAAYCRKRQMGWDVTDFGSGDFSRKGLVLICLRNGIVGHDEERSYAEKLLVLREGQEAPYHYHRYKMEDIIVRARGGNLQVQVFDTDENGAALEQPVTVRLDAETRMLPARAPIVLTHGQSITLPPGQAHRLSAEAGHGTAVLGEVSRVNDDLTDNFFFEPTDRLGRVEEDEPAMHPLWSELPG
jgi:D-lyxose ketol-isomerase